MTQPSATTLQSLESRIDVIAQEIGGEALAVSLYDYETGAAWSCQGNRWFHSASTIKVAVLFALFGAVDAGRFTLDSRLHVRNRFLSVIDRQPFRVSAARDADREVHAAIGRTMRLQDLARHMIVTSSNLATNLLVDPIGVEQAQQMLERHDLGGIELARGVEDDKAFEASYNNRVTANGLVGLFRAVYDRRRFTADSPARCWTSSSSRSFGQASPPACRTTSARRRGSQTRPERSRSRRTMRAWCFSLAGSPTCSRF